LVDEEVLFFSMDCSLHLARIAGGVTERNTGASSGLPGIPPHEMGTAEV
jgi:hypothetical protein